MVLRQKVITKARSLFGLERKEETPIRPHVLRYNGRHHKLVHILLWAVMLIFCAFQALFLVTMVRSIMTGHGGPNPNSSDFELYKNSRVSECMHTIPRSTNCSIFEDERYTTYSNEDASHQFIYRLSYTIPSSNGPSGHPLSYGWCDLISCFGETERKYKVIPSKPREAAVVSAGFCAWCSINMFAITALWAVIDVMNKPKNTKNDAQSADACKEPIGIFTLLLMLYDVISFPLWWHSFFKLISQPDYYTGISLYNWFTPFRYLMLLEYHPYSCQLKSAGAMSIVFKALAAAALL